MITLTKYIQQIIVNEYNIIEIKLELYYVRTPNKRSGQLKIK